MNDYYLHHSLAPPKMEIHVKRKVIHKAIERYDRDGAQLAEITNDKEVMSHFTSEEELYRFIDALLNDREGGIYSPREGYLELTNKEGT